MHDIEICTDIATLSSCITSGRTGQSAFDHLRVSRICSSQSIDLNVLYQQMSVYETEQNKTKQASMSLLDCWLSGIVAYKIVANFGHVQTLKPRYDRHPPVTLPNTITIGLAPTSR